KQNVDAEAQRKAAAQVDTLRSFAIAASGIAIFVVIVFFFLVVKIERNLRLVHTAPANPA
ncbi:MAG TPA: hypothetical protein VMU37_00645, partial [Caulobacteraceae bacterium]|nr:hypothetical protein [Caulobacteraceae bacterium]